MEEKIFYRPFIFICMALIGMGSVNAKGPECRSLFVVSGGGSPTSNHERYYESIERAHQAFTLCPISNFVTSGNPADKVTLTYDSVRVPRPDAPKKFIKVKKLLLDESGLPVLQSRIPEGGFQGAASYEDIKAAAEKLAGEKEVKKGGLFSRKVEPKPVVVYVTDHGVNREGKGEIVLWNEKKLSVPQLSDILNTFPESQKVVVLFDQCYGGDMLKSLWNAEGKVRPNTCGLAAASSGQISFSTGGVMKKIHQIFVEKDVPLRLKRKKSLTYRDIYESLAGEEEIRSTPMISSDLFANEWLNKRFSFSPPISGVTARWEGALSKDLLLPTEKHCFFKKGGLASKLLPTSVQERLRKEWEYIRGEYSELSPKETSTEQLLEQLKLEEAAVDKAHSRFQKFVAQRYNRNIREKAETLSKDTISYNALKTRENAGEKLSESEQAQLMQMQVEIDLLKLSIRDEAKIASRHPGISFKTNPDELTMELVAEHEKRKKAKNDTANTMFRTQHKLVKLATLNFIDKIMVEGDLEAAQSYIGLLDCENSVLGEVEK